MKRIFASVPFASLVLLAACRQAPPVPIALEAAPPASAPPIVSVVEAGPAASARAADPPDPDAPYRCKVDADCGMSCALGAVGARWVRAHANRYSECDDGCAGPAMQAQCKDGLCAAFDTRNAAAPRFDASCTHRRIELTR